MPSDEEFRELKDQVASLTSALATARRRIDDLEDGMADHLGLDWGESLVDVNSPHPNISANTIESGGGIIRQDANGMQIATGDSLASGINFVHSLVNRPADGLTERAFVSGGINTSFGIAQVQVGTETPSGNDSATLSVSKTEDTESNISAGVTFNGVSAYVRSIGYADFMGLWVYQGGLQFDSSMSPAQITANVNDYSPSGSSPSYNAASALRLSSDASRDITGMAGGLAGRVLLIFNVGSFNIVLKDESASSTAANRFALKADITLAPDGSALLWYDSTTSRWRCAGTY